ncbi:lipoyl(octanoyl) transferase LipB [Variovorax sp. PCZ-1]|uniref:lipoyl(octanoyl) transferase LipB n=1 Tax=Variovorax sp. PCZ-1 TaxID=2835533 RepID=UPI001BD0854C|nr:lipoyl(octanoyl) transferase LipB [Variovorax sp. PCZ-1]MBS7808755.1 lipoyl(octanoyl) transferase LipB [Variovorax sp. PCZ-1]
MQVEFKGLQPYAPSFEAMQAYVAQLALSRGDFLSENGTLPAQDLREVLWICEHPPVFTQGLAGKAEHVLMAGDIPVVQTNRGGQVTYHGPGQVVAYPMIDLRARNYFVKEYVHRLEEATIRTLAHFGLTGHRVRGAPGIYVRLDEPASHARLLGADGQPMQEAELATRTDIGKIAALGIKVSRHITYHGLALNVAMDLSPYERINPCGYAGLRTVDMAFCGVSASWDEVAKVLADKLVTYLG